MKNTHALRIARLCDARIPARRGRLPCFSVKACTEREALIIADGLRAC
jgi:hypothetical protein